MTSGRVLQGHKGSYTLESESFNFGRVAMLFRAHDEAGQVVCVKSFEKTGSDFSLDAFHREVQVYGRLSHPNVLALIDHGDDATRDKPFMVMPYCEGGDLSRAMQGRNFFPVDEALAILRQVAGALDHSHAKGYIHGDVKPGNILFDRTGSRAFLSDYGIARMFPFVEAITQPGAGAGTTTYLSPEQIRAHQQTPRSDIYSLAVVAYQLLTGSLPFDTNAPLFEQLLAKIEGKIVEPRQANPMLSAAASRGLRQGLSTNPLERPVNALAFCEQLGSKDGTSTGTDSETKGAHEAGSRKARVFVSYSHQDEKYLGSTSLFGFLSGLSREGIEFWHDQLLLPGESWDQRIREELGRADVVVALVSQAFLNSAYCQVVEIAQFLRQRRENGLVVFPVILSACDWKSHEWLANTQFLPAGGKTIEGDFPGKGKRAELYTRILEDLRTISKRVRARQEGAGPL